MFILLFLILKVFSWSSPTLNPFEINFEKKNLSDHDYKIIRTLLLHKNISDSAFRWYNETSHELFSFDIFLNRINRGLIGLDSI